MIIASEGSWGCRKDHSPIDIQARSNANGPHKKTTSSNRSPRGSKKTATPRTLGLGLIVALGVIALSCNFACWDKYESRYPSCSLHLVQDLDPRVFFTILIIVALLEQEPDYCWWSALAQSPDGDARFYRLLKSWGNDAVCF